MLVLIDDNFRCFRDLSELVQNFRNHGASAGKQEIINRISGFFSFPKFLFCEFNCFLNFVFYQKTDVISRALENVCDFLQFAVFIGKQEDVSFTVQSFLCIFFFGKLDFEMFRPAPYKFIKFQVFLFLMNTVRRIVLR